MGLVGRGLPSVAVDGGVVAAGDAAGVALEVREAPLGSGMSEGVRWGAGRDLLSLMTPFSPLAHFDYQFGYRKFDGAEGPRTPKYMNNITYYFDNVSSTELYSVDQELLKDYIKRQM